MKQIIFAGCMLAMVSGITASAQNNGGYQDDVYYNASQAEKDAKADAKKTKTTTATKYQQRLLQ